MDSFLPLSVMFPAVKNAGAFSDGIPISISSWPVRNLKSTKTKPLTESGSKLPLKPVVCSMPSRQMYWLRIKTNWTVFHSHWMLHHLLTDNALSKVSLVYNEPSFTSLYTWNQSPLILTSFSGGCLTLKLYNSEDALQIPRSRASLYMFQRLYSSNICTELHSHIGNIPPKIAIETLLINCR